LGHVPHIQAPEVFNAALLKFLREDAGAATHTAAK
jgi:pimeloyl-ACP methyl ester carboxylesterase